MRLAIVRRRFASAGGAERFIVNTTKALGSAGVEVTLLAEGVEKGGGDARRWLRLPAAKGSRSRRYRAFQAAAAAALAENRFDIVQAHERILDAHLFRAGDGVHAAWVERLARSRPAWRRPFLAADPFHRLLMETERRMARETDMLFVANSGMVAREIAAFLDVPASRLRLIENGVDLAHFTPTGEEERARARAAFGLPAEARVAVFVGSGFERKGAFPFLQALALPALRDVRALVAGRDKQADGLARLAERLRLSERVALLGAVGDVRPVLHAADILVLPTLYDPMPNAALEAVASGVPVLTTADAGIADHLTASGAGAIATRDPDDLAAGIAGLLDHAKAAREAAVALRGHFDLSRKTEEWLALYRQFA